MDLILIVNQRVRSTTKLMEEGVGNCYGLWCSYSRLSLKLWLWVKKASSLWTKLFPLEIKHESMRENIADRPRILSLL